MLFIISVYNVLRYLVGHTVSTSFVVHVTLTHYGGHEEHSPPPPNSSHILESNAMKSKALIIGLLRLYIICSIVLKIYYQVDNSDIKIVCMYFMNK